MALAQLIKTVLFVGFAGLSTAACGAPVAEVGSANDTQASASNGEAVMTNKSAAISERFESLDAYLLHLQQTNAPIDKPYYREIRPDVYQLTTGNLRVLPGDESAGAGTHIFTREELERKFGFRK